jgi:lysophospholipase L1-like esterase
MTFSSYIAIGDSFTEGVGDEQEDGTVRGWADLVARGLAEASSEPVRYANLAIRGRLLAPIVTDQLEAAIAQRPELISINGGGNNIMRPAVSIDDIARQLVDAAERVTAAGIHALITSGANPTKHIPLGASIGARGDQLARAVRSHLPLENVTFVDNWADSELTKLRYWSVDKLHLGPLGHRRVARNILTGLGLAVHNSDEATGPDPQRPGTAAYWRGYVVPWIGRRLTGRSSGDGREPKIATLTLVPKE